MRSATALLPYAFVVGFAFAWQSGITWAAWPAVGIALLVAVYAAYAIAHRRARPKPDNYVGKFRRPDGSVVHVARMPSGQLWVASDTQPPEKVGYVDGREMMRWEKLASEPGV